MKFYKSGSLWVVDAQSFDAGTCYKVESANGNRVEIKFLSDHRSLTNGCLLYTDYTDSAGNAYTKDQVNTLLDAFLCKTFTDASGNPLNKPSRLVCEFTRPANTTDYAAFDVVSIVAANQKKKETVTLGGTDGTYNLSIPNIANRTVAFTTTLDLTAAKFVTDYAADFLPLVVVTASTNTIIFEAATAGVDFADVVKSVTLTATATIAHTTPNLSLAMLSFDADAVSVAGGACMITAAFIEAPAKFASQTMTLRLYNAIPATILGDNVPFVLDTTNALKRNGVIEMELKPVINAATVVSATVAPFLSFQAASGSKKIYAKLIVGGAVVAPETAGKFTIILNVTQL